MLFCACKIYFGNFILVTDSQKRRPPSTTEQTNTDENQQPQDQNANPVVITPYENTNKSHTKRNLNVISEDERMSSRPSTPVTKSASRRKAEGTKERSRSKRGFCLWFIYSDLNRVVERGYFENQ